MEMSDDLISRKALLKELREIMDEPHNTMFLMGIGAAVSIVEHRETAFDKEKVIEKINREIEYHHEKSKIASMEIRAYSDGAERAYRLLRSIVEKGGIEWRKLIWYLEESIFTGAAL